MIANTSTAGNVDAIDTRSMLSCGQQSVDTAHSANLLATQHQQSVAVRE